MAGGPWDDFKAPSATSPDSGPWNDFAPKKTEPAATGAEPPGRRAIATTKDGGTVWELVGGKRVFSSPNYSTSDPAQIEKLMEGATPADVSTSSWDNSIIDQHPVAARAIKAVEGTPFVGSYGDEAVGAVFGGDARDAWRATSKAMGRENPWQSAGLGIAGGVALSAPALMAAGPSIAGGSLLGNMGRGAAVGAVEGAVRGFGDGEGGVHERGMSSMTNALLGLAIGGAIPAIAHGAGAAYRGARNALADYRGVGQVANSLSVDRDAARLLADTMDMDNPYAVRNALAHPGAMLADGGPNSRKILDAVIQSPGPGGRLAMDRIEGRAADAGNRLNTALDDALTGKGLGSAGGRQFSDTARMQGDLRDATAAARKSLYDRAYAAPIDYSGPDGAALLDQVTPRLPPDAISYANKLMRMRGEKSGQIMAQIADDGTVTFQTLPDVRQWDYIKQALDGLAESGDGAGALGGQTRMGAAYQSLARDIRGSLGRAVPEYDHAVNTAGDIIGQVKAIKVGETLLSPGTTRAEVEATLDGMSSGERDAVKRGLRQSIDDAVANVRAVASDPNLDAREAYKAYTMLTSRASHDKMKMLLGDDWPPLEKALDEAARALSLRAGVATGSGTAVRSSFKQMLDDSLDPGAIRRGEPISSVREVWQLAAGATPKQVQRAKEGVKNELADLLTRPDAAAIYNALSEANRAFPISHTAGTGIRNALAGFGAASAPTLGTELHRRIRLP